MTPITIYRYIISNNASAIKPLMRKHGKTYPANWDSLSEADKLIILERSMQNLITDVDFRRDLIALHPDIQIIDEHLNSNPSRLTNLEIGKEQTFETKNSATGFDKTIKDQLTTPKLSNILIGVAVGIGAIYIIKNVIQS